MKKLTVIAMLIAVVGLSLGLLALTTNVFHGKYQPGDNDGLYEDPQ